MAQLDEARTVADTPAAHVTDHNTLHRQSNYVFDVKSYGAVGDGVANDAVAVQAAIDAAEAASKPGTVYFPPGTYKCGATLTVNTDGVSLIGAGWGSSFIRTSADDLFDIQGALLTFADLYLASDAGGGHIFNQTASVHLSTFRDLQLLQQNNAKSIWDNNGFQYLDNEWTRFNSQHTAAASVPSFKFVSVNGDLNINRWHRFRHTYSGDYVFYIESTAAGSYAYDNMIVHGNFEVCVGGAVKLLGNFSPVLESLAMYDSGTILKDVFVLGAGSGGVNTFDATLIAVTRRGGSLDTGIVDIDFTGSITSLKHVFISCGGTSGAGFTIDANSKLASVIGGSNITLNNATYVLQLGRVIAPTVTGARDDGTALADLLTELATLGLITDSSTAT